MRIVTYFFICITSIVTMPLLAYPRRVDTFTFTAQEDLKAVLMITTIDCNNCDLPVSYWIHDVELYQGRNLLRKFEECSKDPLGPIGPGYPVPTDFVIACDSNDELFKIFGNLNGYWSHGFWERAGRKVNFRFRPPQR